LVSLRPPSVFGASGALLFLHEIVPDLSVYFMLGPLCIPAPAVVDSQEVIMSSKIHLWDHQVHMILVCKMRIVDLGYSNSKQQNKISGQLICGNNISFNMESCNLLFLLSFLFLWKLWYLVNN